MGAYAPALSACVALGESRETVVRQIREAVEFEIEGPREQGEAPPLPHTFSEQVEIDA